MHNWGFGGSFWGLEGSNGVQFWCLGSQMKTYFVWNAIKAKQKFSVSLNFNFRAPGVHWVQYNWFDPQKLIFDPTYPQSMTSFLFQICLFLWDLNMGFRKINPLPPSWGQIHFWMGAYFSSMICGKYPTNLFYQHTSITNAFHFSWIWVPHWGQAP